MMGHVTFPAEEFDRLLTAGARHMGHTFLDPFGVG